MKKISRFATAILLAASFTAPLLAFAGSVPAGGTCVLGSECASGVCNAAHCVGNGATCPTGQTSVGGQCVANTTAGTINQTYLTYYYTLILTAVNSYLVPILIAISFIVFLFGAYRYFIYHGDEDTKREEGRKFILWGIIGFVIILSVWSIVNIVKDTLIPTSAQNNHPTYPTL